MSKDDITKEEALALQKSLSMKDVYKEPITVEAFVSDEMEKLVKEAIQNLLVYGFAKMPVTSDYGPLRNKN